MPGSAILSWASASTKDPVSRCPLLSLIACTKMTIKIATGQLQDEDRAELVMQVTGFRSVRPSRASHCPTTGAPPFRPCRHITELRRSEDSQQMWLQAYRTKCAQGRKWITGCEGCPPQELPADKEQYTTQFEVCNRCKVSHSRVRLATSPVYLNLLRGAASRADQGADTGRCNIDWVRGQQATLIRMKWRVQTDKAEASKR